MQQQSQFHREPTYQQELTMNSRCEKLMKDICDNGETAKHIIYSKYIHIAWHIWGSTLLGLKRRKTF